MEVPSNLGQPQNCNIGRRKFVRFTKRTEGKKLDRPFAAPEAVVTEKSHRWRYCIGGYTKGMHGFDAIIIGFYRGKELIYTSRVRATFVPATKRVDSVSNRSSTFNE